MRKKHFTKKVGLILSKATYNQLIEQTSKKEVSVSQWIREAIEKRLFIEGREMKKQQTVASPELTEELLQDPDLVQEYVGYLRLKGKRNHEGSYYCGTSEDAYKCWNNTEKFCKEKGLDYDTVVYTFTSHFACESNIANAPDLDVFRKLAINQ